MGGCLGAGGGIRGGGEEGCLRQLDRRPEKGGVFYLEAFVSVSLCCCRPGAVHPVELKLILLLGPPKLSRLKFQFRVFSFLPLLFCLLLVLLSPILFFRSIHLNVFTGTSFHSLKSRTWCVKALTCLRVTLHSLLTQSANL